ncbi:hypothetical protein ABE142_10190 [Paenibacillus alvei]|uniref:hypothetical protein n=1 Tax=Paenibacillus alvei TaxID=44250 RepID=UPI003D274C27
MKFTYELNSIGWANVYLHIGNTEMYMEPSYLSEPLVDLVRSIELLLPECSPEDEVRNVVQFDWDSEPAIHNWLIERISEDRVQIKIFLYKDGIKTLPGELVFSEECEMKLLIHEVVNSMELLLKNHGIIGYRRQWCAQDFPISSYLQLKYYLFNNSSFPMKINNPNEWIEKIETSINEELELMKVSIL